MTLGAEALRSGEKNKKQMFWGLWWTWESWWQSTWCGLEMQAHGSGLRLPCRVQGRRTGGLSFQLGLLCWGCCPVAPTGSQAHLRVCRVQDFLQTALSKSPLYKLSFASSSFM